METERLRAELAALPQFAGKTIAIRPAGKPRAHTYSLIQHFSLEIDGAPPRRIVVKAPRGRLAADPVAAFTALQTLDRHFRRTPDLHSPAPLLALPDPPVLVMEAAAGQPLYKLLQKCRRPPAAQALQMAVVAAASAGRWLAHLHKLPPSPGARPLSPAPHRRALVLDRLRARGVDAQWLAGIEQRLSNSPPPTEAVTLHGDFSLRNILCAPDGVTVLDTELARRGPAAHDLAYFLVSLAFFDRWRLFIARWLHEIRIVESVKQAFLGAYAAEAGPIDPETLAIHTIGRALQRWAEYGDHMRAQHPLAGPALAAAADRHFRRVIAGELKALATENDT